jgi:hypothetical protein
MFAPTPFILANGAPTSLGQKPFSREPPASAGAPALAGGSRLNGTEVTLADRY